MSDIHNEMRESKEMVEDYALEPTGLDPKSRSLQAELSVTLKTWREDTRVSAVMGETWLDMTQTEPGVFTAPLKLPAERGEVPPLELLIDNGGQQSARAWASGRISLCCLVAEAAADPTGSRQAR